MMIKKMMALSVVCFMTLGLVACGSEINPSDQESLSTSSSTEVSSSDNTTQPEVEKNPFEGLEIEVWGIDGNTYTNPENVKGNSTWLRVSAMEEWCKMNGCTLKYVTSVDTTAMMAAVNSGQTPDLVMTSNTFPNLANIGLLQALDDEAYEQLSKAAGGKQYLDVVSYKNDCYGVVYPWNGIMMVSYNRSQFERYGVKTPKEYFLEGNWTWETLMKCAEEVTRDVDGDGNNDTYGIDLSTLAACMVPYVTENNDGKLLSPLETEKCRKLIEMIYTGVNETGSIVKTSDHLWTKVEGVRPCMRFVDCGPYDLPDIYHEVANGDLMEAVPTPVYTLDNPEVYQRINSIYMAIPAACDNVDAVVSMMTYILECGTKYLSEQSYGALECEYEGVQGITEISAKWLTMLRSELDSQKEDIINRPEYDPEYLEKMREYVASYPLDMNRVYSGVSNVFGASNPFESILKVPPASSISECAPIFQGQLDKYNSLYVY